VVLRPEALRERLLRLEEVISRLEELANLERAEIVERFQNAWAAERGLQLGAEIIFDIGNHILSAQFGKSAQDYEDIVAQLHQVAVISAGTRERLRGLGGFRNILVHGYLAIDPDRVIAHLREAPTRFSEFNRDVRAWLATVKLS
jgi:uncharacterized protein YutE (UPF0331/DUF86 family)